MKVGEAETKTRMLKSGLTWRSALALIYIIVSFQPTMLYISLVAGVPGAFGGVGALLIGSIQWGTLILLVELTRMSGNPLTKQEATIIYLCGYMGSMGTYLLQVIYQAWFKYSPTAASFNLTSKIPYFYAPPEKVWLARTFFDPSWVPILTIWTVWILTSVVCTITRGIFCRQLYIEVENLSFPLAQPPVQTIVALSERQEGRLRNLAVFTLIGFIFAAVVYGIPFIAQAIGVAFVIGVVPIPWADWNYIVHFLGLKGASFGLATDLALLATGLIIPFPAIIGIFAGSFALYFIGNFILVSYGLTTFAETWTPGLTIDVSWARSLLYAWINPIVGLSLAIGVMPIILRPKVFTSTFKMLKGGSEAKFKLSLWMIMVPYLVATAAYVILSAYYAPDFPLWIYILLNMVWPFIFVLASSRAQGEAIEFSIPYFRELIYIGSGYTGYDAWFVPSLAPAANWAFQFKICDLTDTDPMSLVKVTLLMWPVGALAGFFFLSVFWQMAPIPSHIYTSTVMVWPVTATWQGLFTTHPPGLFNPTAIAAGFAVATVLYLILMRFGLTSALIGAVIGATSPIPTAAGILLGGIAGQIIPRFVGKEWWNDNKAIAVAGITLGEGLLVSFAVSIAIIAKAMWILPY